MMNNHFHLQQTHENVAQQFAGTVAAAPATYSYLAQPTTVTAAATTTQNPQQWLTYQIMPPNVATTAGGGLPPVKRYYANAAAAAAAAATTNSIQITNNYAQQQQQQQQQQQHTANNNNIRIISTAPNVYSLNKATNQLYATPTSTTAAATGGASDLYGAYYATNKLQPPPLVPVSNNNNNISTNNNNNTAAVVLDRINICINNHYAEANLCQPSPIIPAIQHKALLPLIDSSTADSSCSSSSSSNILTVAAATPSTAAVIVIDEPDSTTTTPQTPPTTPETLSNSPLKSPELKQSYSIVAVLAPPTPPTPPPAAVKSPSPTPDPKPTPSPISSTLNFTLQEDVFIKCNDGRFYLGTIIAQSDEQYLVRFGDKSEQWCEPQKLRKLGHEPSSSSGSDAAANPSGPMCVACKRHQQHDTVEICERCGRGYHRGCTSEIAPGIWCCKRCAKPMKVQAAIVQQLELNKPKGICRQLPYHVDKLSWDEKHRVNEEQIYCYCGKPGKFDHNMLQCCKCRNWFHTQCMQHFKGKLLRGDMFFVFCCTVCNEGVEFVRRLQIDWVDMLHITLYNLRKHQHQKYHHLLKDIWPFILEQRHHLPICEEWRQLPETKLMEKIKQTLKEYSDRFVCGREFKRAPAYYALRHSGPPLTPRVFLQSHEILSDELLVQKFRLLLMPAEQKELAVKDVYEFQTDEDELDTSEDEIPIKQIIDMAKKQTATVEQLMPSDDNANDVDIAGKLLAPAAPAAAPSNGNGNGNSRKRKAFRLSKRYDSSSRHCDLSSDENSSSSRGTSSLDLIIPPPANFLGRNNPFLMATPKKTAQQRQGTGLGVGVGMGVTGLINSIFKLKSAKQLSQTQQPRMVRTIKRRLSAKDITIGPNQEVRRRRNRRLTTAIEVINTTTINPLPSHYFPLYAKDLPPPEKPAPAAHGRLLRQRPQKSKSPSNSRRNSNSSTATNNSNPAQNSHSLLDLKQSVNKYFGGAINRIDAGESFAIRAKRRLGNGQVQYLVEWCSDTVGNGTPNGLGN